MRRSQPSRLISFTFIALLCSASGSFAQVAPGPWSGIAARESEHGDPWSNYHHRTFKDAISGDGRFVVFTRSFGDNYPGDILLRDRVTRELRRLNVAWDGSEPVAPSYGASISADGRHVIFVSCGSLTADDVNTFCDLYARDVERGAITRISIGPSGEEPLSDAGLGSISNDGRFVAFTAQFYGAYGHPRLAWVRDRDADGNGIFDEPGATTTTLVSVKADGSPAVSDYGIAINGGDARYVAFTSWDSDVVPGYLPGGARLYVRDLQDATTFRVDVPSPGTADDGWSGWPDLSDDGSVLVYESTLRVTEGDFDSEYDVFAFNLWTGGNTQVLSDGSAPGGFERVMLPSISGDGRYVAVAAQPAGAWSWEMNAWIIERATAEATQVTRPLEGWSATYSPLEVSLTSDGSELLLSAYPLGLVHDYWPYGRSVFVVTASGLSPAEQTVPAAGGTFSASVAVPDDIAWTARTLYEWITLDTASGNGPGALTYSVAPNTGRETRIGYIWLGSHQTAITQLATPSIDYVSPFEGPVTGGFTVSISGSGFEEGATVFFDGAAASSVAFVDNRLLEAVAPARERSGPVEIRVVNPDGLVASQFPAFWYRDETPPVIEPTIEGPLGFEGFYVGDVTVRWTVTEPESEPRIEGCDTRAFTEDGRFYSFCAAYSEGGPAERWLEIARDTTGPEIDVWSPWDSPYAQQPARLARGTEIPAAYDCRDQVSGTMSCEGDVPSSALLDTSATGSFTFTVRARDRAGNQTVKQVPYVVVSPTTLGADIAGGEYGGTAVLAATLTSDGTPVAGRTVRFWVAHSIVGTSVTTASGVASLTLALGARSAGSYFVWAEFDGDDTYFPSAAPGTLVIAKATPPLTWSAPAPMTYPATLSATQLNATSPVAGTFTYAPPAGTTLTAGVHTLTAAFTPFDVANYNQATAAVTLTVIGSAAEISWAAPAPILFGTALGSAQMNASASHPGIFAYSPPAGTVLPAGTHTLTVTFQPDDLNVQPATATVSLTVARATPAITWAAPAPVVYGTPLGAAQLGAAAGVPGTFDYTPAPGTVLRAGTHTLTVIFTPSDGDNYTVASRSVSIAVAAAPLTVRAHDAVSVFGAPLPTFTAAGLGFVNGDSMASLFGALAFSTAAGSGSTPGAYAVMPGGLSSTDYAIAFEAGTLTISRASTAMTLVSSPNPSGNNKTVGIVATITVLAPGNGSPTGTVEFRDKGVLIGTAAIVDGSATLTTSFRKGSHPLTAIWTGDANLVGSSASSTHLVN